MQAGLSRFVLLKFTTNGVILQCLETNDLKEASEAELVDKLLNGEVTTPDTIRLRPNEVDALNPALQARILTRNGTAKAIETMVVKLKWIDELKRRGVDKIDDRPWVRLTMKQIAEEHFEGKQQFEISTLQDTGRKLIRTNGDPISILPDFASRGGAGHSRLHVETERIINEVLEEVKKDRGPIVKTQITQDIRTRIDILNLANAGINIPAPGAATVTRRITASIPAFEICSRNKGLIQAKREYREHAFSRDTATRPLEVAEYDDADCSVFLVDRRTGLPQGRAIMTNGVCQNTWVPLGYDISHVPRSFDSAIGAIHHSLLPKNTSHPDFAHAKGAWEGYGAQGIILMDNARYNFSKSTRYQADQFALRIAGARPYGPTEKSVIEHYNHRVKSDFSPTLPGWRGEKNDPDAVKEGMGSAILFVDQFRALYVKWVVDVYMNSPGVDGWTPRQRWNQVFQKHRPAVRWSKEDLAILRLRPEVLKFRESGGLERLDLRYNNDWLISLKGFIGVNSSVVAYTDRDDLTYIVVQDPRSRELYRVGCTEHPQYVNGLTERQQQLIRKIARQRGVTNPSLRDLVEARHELKKRTEQMSRSNKMTLRRKSSLVGDMPDVKITLGDHLQDPPVEKKIVQVLMTELEYEISQLELVDLGDEEEMNNV